jgi:ketosteroid isomerase-like protein
MHMNDTNKSAVDAVLEFLDRIIHHDVDKLAECMTEDHVFIDSLGQSVSGRENMRAGYGQRLARLDRLLTTAI